MTAAAAPRHASHPDFPVIDAHVHLYPDEIAAKVTPALAHRFGNAPSFDGTVAGCAACDAAAGIAASLNLPVATKPDSVDHTNAFWAAHAPHAPRAAAPRAPRAAAPHAAAPRAAVFSLAAFHPDVADKGAAVERIAAAGFTGIKLHPEYQCFRFNERRMDDAWAAMSELGVAAYLHAGGERVFNPPYHSTPAEIAELQRRFPKLTIVAAHLGGFGMWNEAEAMLVGTDVNLDLSHTFAWMPGEQLLRMVRRHGAHRILFGTDAPWQDPRTVLESFLALPLADAERRAICHDNAARLFGLAAAAPAAAAAAQGAPQ